MKSLKDIEKLVTESNVKPRSEMRSKVLDDALKLQGDQKQQNTSGIYTRRTIMKSRITKFAAAAIIIIAALIVINPFDGSNIAFADVLKNIQNAKTLSWKTTIITEGQRPQTSHILVREPYNMRVELEDGRVWILDHLKGKTLVLEQSRKFAVVSSTAITSLEIYDTFKNFQNMEGFLIEETGQKQINGKLSIGFRLTKEDDGQEIMVWADLETGLPVLIEETKTYPQSSIDFLTITNDIIFDAELDEALFSITPPEGYVTQSMEGPRERAAQLASRTQSAANINQILKNCLDYVEENSGQWPNTLYELVNFGLDKEVLVNPRQPELENGYVYLKPERHLSPSDIILYEAYDVWSIGINVGFVDGHIEFIKEESDFRERLLK